MNDNPIKFHAYYNPASGRVEMYVRHGRAHAINVTFSEELPIGSEIVPLFRLEYEEAQTLMDSLYEAGLRPRGAAGSAGQLDAVKYHLEDMRRLVFKERT